MYIFVLPITALFIQSQYCVDELVVQNFQFFKWLFLVNFHTFIKLKRSMLILGCCVITGGCFYPVSTSIIQVMFPRGHLRLSVLAKVVSGEINCCYDVQSIIYIAHQLSPCWQLDDRMISAAIFILILHRDYLNQSPS